MSLGLLYYHDISDIPSRAQTASVGKHNPRRTAARTVGLPLLYRDNIIKSVNPPSVHPILTYVKN